MTLLLSSGGVFVICKVEQCLAQRQMAEAINEGKASFLTIKLSVTDFEKNKVNNHEIIVGGKMYDIRHVSICHDIVELVVAHDVKEENILNKLTNTIQKSEKKNSSLPADFVKLLSVIYISPSSETWFADLRQPVKRFITKNESVLYRTGETPSPPPKFVSTFSFIA